MLPAAYPGRPDGRRTCDEKRQRALRPAAAETVRKGFHNSSIRASGASTSGLYYYVRGREELLFPLPDRGPGTVPDSPGRRLAGVPDPHRRQPRAAAYAPEDEPAERLAGAYPRGCRGDLDMDRNSGTLH